MNQLVIMSIYICMHAKLIWSRTSYRKNINISIRDLDTLLKKRKEKRVYICIPVVDSGSVGKRFVKHLSTDGLGGRVAPRMEHAPPNVVSFASRSRCRRCCRSQRGCRCRRHGQTLLQLATFSFVYMHQFGKR